MSKHILTEIWIYPIKSLGGIRLSSSGVMEKGLPHDRRWMLVDENNTFMTQREYPSMSLLRLKMQESFFTVTAGTKSIRLDFERHHEQEPIQTQVWDDPVTTFEVSRQHSQWFSDQLKLTCKLVCFPEEGQRRIDPDFVAQEKHVSLADGYPFLIVGTESLNDLNTRLQTPVPMNRFRPNLVFTGGTAYEEDTWQKFAIGKNRFLGVKPCGRCIMTTINQETAEKGIEPLLTLSKYRKSGANVYFGQNVIPIDCDEIHEGDEISFE